MVSPVLALTWWRRLALLAFVLLLGACAAPPAIQGAATETAFQRGGRFAVSVDEVGGEPQAVQGGFAWYDAGHRLALDLANPLGSTLARVEVLPGRAVLTRTDGSTQVATNPDALLEQVVGVAVPVSGLREWLKGRVGKAAQDIQTDGAGVVSSFMQDGWSVSLSRHDSLGPRVLQLKRKEGLRTISVRLVIDAS